MGLSEKEITLQSCLQECGLRELPPKIGADYNKTWLRAICLVTKVYGIQSYVLCENDGHGKAVCKCDFGTCASILRYDAIHPYEEADNTIVPTFANDAEILHYLTKSKYDRSEVEKLLSVEGKSLEQIQADRSEINRRVNDVALGVQKRKIAEKKRCNEIKEFAQKAKEEKQKTKTNGRRKKEIK